MESLSGGRHSSRQVSSPSHDLLGDFVRIPGNQLRRAFRTLRGGFAIGEIMYVNVVGRLLPIPGSSGIDNSKRVESIPWRASRGTSASQIAGSTLETQEHDSVRRAASPSQRGGTHFRCFSGKSSVLWSNPSDAQVQKQLAVVVTLIGQKRGSRRPVTGLLARFARFTHLRVASLPGNWPMHPVG
jgi:hypothetical protein